MELVLNNDNGGPFCLSREDFALILGNAMTPSLGKLL